MILRALVPLCQHKINLEADAKPVRDPQRRLNPKMKEVVRKEILKHLEAGIIYPVADSEWVSPVHCVPKKGGITVIPNDKDELIPQRIITGYRMVIHFRKLNKATKKTLPLTFYRSNARKTIQTYTFLLSRWLFWFLSNTCVSR